MDKHAPSIRIIALFSLVLLALAGTAQAAALYKWTDEEGNVHYSQSPPESNSAEKIVTDEAPANQGEANNGEMADGQDGASAEGDKQATDENGIPVDAGQDPAIAEKRRKNCEIARQNMNTYKEYRKIRTPDGKMVIMSDEMRAAKIDEAQKMIEEYCE